MGQWIMSVCTPTFKSTVGKLIERRVLNYRELRSFPGTLSEMSPDEVRYEQKRPWMEYMPKSNRDFTLILTRPTHRQTLLMMDPPKLMGVRVSQT